MDAEAAVLAAANPVWAGTPIWLPDGITPAAAMLQAVKDADPRRRSVLEHALANDDAFQFHPIGPVQR